MFRVAKNPEPTWILRSWESGTHLVSGFPETEPETGIHTLNMSRKFQLNIRVTGRRSYFEILEYCNRLKSDILGRVAEMA